MLNNITIPVDATTLLDDPSGFALHVYDELCEADTSRASHARDEYRDVAAGVATLAQMHPEDAAVGHPLDVLDDAIVAYGQACFDEGVKFGVAAEMRRTELIRQHADKLYEGIDPF